MAENHPIRGGIAKGRSGAKVSEISENSKRDRAKLDAVVVTAVLDGDTERFRELVDHYKGFAISLAYSMTGDFDLANEIAQDSFVKAYENLVKLLDRTKFHSWLYGVIKNTSFVHLKKRKRARGVSYDLLLDNHITLQDEKTLSPDLQMIAEQRNESVWKAIRSLNEKYQDVILLFHFHSKSYEEIGSILGLEHKGVDSRLRRARLMLRDKLKNLINE